MKILLVIDDYISSNNGTTVLQANCADKGMK